MQGRVALFVAGAVALLAPLAPVPAGAQAAAVCQTQQPWQEGEQWVLAQVCAGLAADLASKFGGGRFANPTPVEAQSWLAGRSLSAAFMKALLSADVGAIEIAGARFPGGFDISLAHLQHDLVVKDALFDKAVRMDGVHVEGSVRISGSTMPSLSLRLASIAGELDLTKAIVRGEADLAGADVRHDVKLDDGSFNGAILTTLRVGGRLSLLRAAFDAAQANGPLAAKAGLNLVGARIDGQLALLNTTVHGDALLAGMSVGGDLDFVPKEISGDVDARRMQVTGDVRIGGCTYEVTQATGACSAPSAISHRLDISGTRVGGGIDLEPNTQWGSMSRLILEGANAGALRPTRGTCRWPPTVDMYGFTFGHVRWLDESNPCEGAAPTAELASYKKWLALDTTFAPQPYQQMADTLRAAGERAAANEVAVASKDRERANASWLGWLWLTVLLGTIGYGIGDGYFLTVIWVGALVVAGRLVLKLSGDDKKSGIGWWYSIDLALPFVTLNREYEKAVLAPRAQNYFFVHQLLGYLFAFFLLAGLTGLTK